MTNLQFAICNLQFALLLATSAARAGPPLAVPVDGEPFHAELTAVDANWQITFTTGKKQRTIAAADLVTWGQCPEQGRGGTLVLADGGLLAADVVAADQQRLTADSDPFGTLKIPLDALAGVVFRPPSDPQRRDALFDRLAQAAGDSISPLPLGEGQGVRADSDRLLLLNGDELTGLFAGIADDAVRLQTGLGPVEVKTDRIAALLFNPALPIVGHKAATGGRARRNGGTGRDHRSRLYAGVARTERRQPAPGHAVGCGR